MSRKKQGVAASLFVCVAALFVGAVSLLGSGCELMVQLDRNLADSGSGEDAFRFGVCSICASEDGGEDAAKDAAGEAVVDAGAALDASGGSDAGGGAAYDAEGGAG